MLGLSLPLPNLKSYQDHDEQKQ